MGVQTCHAMFALITDSTHPQSKSIGLNWKEIMRNGEQ